MLQKLRGHWGFTRLPFGRDLAPSMLHKHTVHNEAVARISRTVSERALGVITGEVGAGKTVAVVSRPGRTWPSGSSSRSGTAGGRRRSRTPASDRRCW